jgi:hypothetical protein
MESSFPRLREGRRIFESVPVGSFWIKDSY